MTTVETGRAVYRARLRGCLLGGAIGDALGNPVEFQALTAIRQPVGLVANAEGVAEITDDTQMTLFSLEGFHRGWVRAQAKGIGGAMASLVRDAYLRWLDTQENPAPPPAEDRRHRSGQLRLEPWLYARRAPGMACLSGLRADHTPDTFAEPSGRPGPVNPDSKGCGTVMRSAPFGFAGGAHHAYVVAANCAQITHGHPTGYHAAGTFAAMIAYLLEGESLEAAVLRSMRLLSRYPSHEETLAALRLALELASSGDTSPEKVESLGGGWVAEEALAIGVYAALAPVSVRDAHPETAFRARLRLAVTHSGDSDSTGSICGNLLGAWHGEDVLPWDWLSQVEGRATIARLADDFAAESAQTRGY
ncbi:ADP-ribosylglycohydrolase family protein [Amycolatopsis sp., V23-08]|uniref:ADP-ribosylglycohydrolase family protein n=1 Tax=Amycolatopsis heterodermiae TaxID=3110235 RepID=A0ABU5RBT6_9PSEU|nr:ADP-ribosylglycohydrolase family protein [Amycolatopsis sp., V23-08]MEA5363713.1 ADP-ribosylglycohydrolase family protein [Amycolatopsis sp., V23-08]